MHLVVVAVLVPNGAYTHTEDGHGREWIGLEAVHISCRRDVGKEDAPGFAALSFLFLVRASATTSLPIISHLSLARLVRRGAGRRQQWRPMRRADPGLPF